MRSGRFVPITFKVNAIILLCLVAGLGALSAYYSRTISATIDESTRNNLKRQSQILFTSIENFMLPGEAPLAVKFFSDIGDLNRDFTIRLFRTSGVPAFSDNATVDTVNGRLDKPRFARRRSSDALSEDRARDAGLKAALRKPPEDAFLRITEDGRTYFIIYKPLINLPKCTGCHGSDHTVRGLIDIKTDISQAVAMQKASYIAAGIGFLSLVALLGILLGRFIDAAVISPMRMIGAVCDQVAEGDFNHRVSGLRNDEIGRLGERVNSMVEGLHERFKLSKFVSASTIRSLKDDRPARKTRLTILFSDIRGFTSYSERRSPEKVVLFLNRLLSIETEIVHRFGGDVDKYVGDEVVAVFSGGRAEAAACEAAIEIQREVRSRSDFLDGLEVGIGITSGDVILGMIGSEKRADYTVIGDDVNTASRLCGAAKKGEILVSETVYSRQIPKPEVKGPYRLKVKGKTEPLRVYFLLSSWGGKP